MQCITHTRPRTNTIFDPPTEVLSCREKKENFNGNLLCAQNSARDALECFKFSCATQAHRITFNTPV